MFWILYIHTIIMAHQQEQTQGQWIAAVIKYSSGRDTAPNIIGEARQDKFWAAESFANDQVGWLAGGCTAMSYVSLMLFFIFIFILFIFFIIFFLPHRSLISLGADYSRSSSL
jgi:hypothetical protein